MCESCRQSDMLIFSSLTGQGYSLDHVLPRAVQLRLSQFTPGFCLFYTKNDFCIHLYNYIFSKIEFVSFSPETACVKMSQPLPWSQRHFSRHVLLAPCTCFHHDIGARSPLCPGEDCPLQTRDHIVTVWTDSLYTSVHYRLQEKKPEESLQKPEETGDKLCYCISYVYTCTRSADFIANFSIFQVAFLQRKS